MATRSLEAKRASVIEAKRASVIERIDGMAVQGGRSSDDKMKAWFLSLPKRPENCVKVSGCKCSLCKRHFYCADGKWDEVTDSRYVSLREEKISPGIIDRNVLLGTAYSCWMR